MRELSIIERKVISGGYSLSVTINASAVMTGRGLPQALQLGLKAGPQQSQGPSAAYSGFTSQLQRWLFTIH